MKRFAFVALIALALPAGLARADMSQAIAEAYAAADGALVLVKCTYADEAGDQEVAGIGICYDATNGEFMTLTLSPKMTGEKIRDLRLELPGAAHETVPAEVLGFRPEAGISFVKATQSHDWKAVRFAASSDLAVGTPVVAVGLMAGDAAATVYAGGAYVSAQRRIPERIYMVTGGWLTGVGSPVFGPDGLAVGLVSRPMYLDYQMATPQGNATVSMSGIQTSSFFLPVEEFGYVLTRIPRGGSAPRPPWLGVMKVLPVGPEQADLLGITSPAAMIDGVVPGTPAEQVGLTNGDVIVALNGEPLEQLATGDLTVRALMQKISRVGDKSIELTLLRKGQEVPVTLPLVDMPMLPEEAPRYLSRELGLLVRERVMLDKHLDPGPTAGVEGMEVLAVGRNSPAVNAGLVTGDIVTNVNGQPVKTAAVFKQLVESSLAEKPTDAVVMLIRRGGEEPKAVSVIPSPPQEAQPFMRPQ